MNERDAIDDALRIADWDTWPDAVTKLQKRNDLLRLRIIALEEREDMDSKLLSEFETIRQRLAAIEGRLDSIEGKGCKTIPAYPQTPVSISEQDTQVIEVSDNAGPGTGTAEGTEATDPA